MRKKHIPIHVMAALLAAALNAQLEVKPRAKAGSTPERSQGSRQQTPAQQNPAQQNPAQQTPAHRASTQPAKTQRARTQQAETPQAEPQQAGTPQRGQLRLGETLPSDLSLLDLQGRRVELRSAPDQALLLCFWSPDCPVTARHAASLQQLAAQQDARCLLVAAHRAELQDPAQRRKLKRQLKRAGLRSPVLLDPRQELQALLRARSTPHAFVFDRHGRLAYRGALSDDPHGKRPQTAQIWPLQALGDLRAGRPVQTPSTPAWGRRIDAS